MIHISSGKDTSEISDYLIAMEDFLEAEQKRHKIKRWLFVGLLVWLIFAITFGGLL